MNYKGRLFFETCKGTFYFTKNVDNLDLIGPKNKIYKNF